MGMRASAACIRLHLFWPDGDIDRPQGRESVHVKKYTGSINRNRLHRKTACD